MRTVRDEDDNSDVTIDDVTATRATGKALLCCIGGEDTWIPQSVITDDSEVYETGHAGKLIVKGWFARKEGLGE